MTSLFNFLHRYAQNIIAAINNPSDNIDLNISWVLIAGNFIIATAWFFYINRGRGRDFSHWTKSFFSPKIWFHKSTRLDLYVILINGFIFSLLILAFTYPSQLSRTWMYDGLTRLFGPPAHLKSFSVTLSVLYTLSMFIFMECMFYWNHRLYHRVPFLWRLHKRHHSAEVLTLLTVSRGHPLATMINLNIYALAFGFASGFFIYFVGTELGEYRLFGLNVLSFSLAFAGGLLSHSHIRVTFPNFISKILISPKMHQAHHSRDHAHFDKNFASSLALLDTIFGTGYIPKKDEKYQFGVDGEKGNKQTITDFYFKL